MKKAFREYAKTLSLVWVGCLILFTLVFLLLLKPQLQLKRDMASQLQQKKDDYAAAKSTSNEETKNRLAREIEELRGELRQYVTDADGAANMTFDISQIANENKVSSFSIKGRDSKGILKIPQCSLIGENRMDVSFNGNYRQFAKFLNELERHDPVVLINKFVITRNNMGQVGHKISMGLSVFVEKDLDS